MVQIQRHPDSRFDVFTSTGKFLGEFECRYDGDGYYYYFPGALHIYSDALLTAIADELKKINKEWDKKKSREKLNDVYRDKE